MPFFRNRCSGGKVKTFLLELLPIIQWLRKYTFAFALNDFIAGTAVGLTVIPQGLAYASIARLPAAFGLYSAFMGPMIYCIFGTSKDISLGPTAIMSALVAAACARPRTWPAELNHPMDHISDPNIAVTLSFFVGIILVALGLARLGFIVNFISHPVITGFICAASVTISTGQVRYWEEGCPDSSPGKANCTVFTLTKINKNATLPRFALPTWDYYYKCDPKDPTDACSHDGHYHVTLGRVVSALGSSFAIIPMMAYLESISIAKGFAQKNDYRISTSQELVAIGMSNFAGAFVSSYPVTGSFSRSSVNNQSNVSTPAGGIMVGVLVILALAFLTPAFEYIPAACLGAVIIMAASQMFDYAGCVEIWRISKLDFVVLAVTFIGCLFDTADGILIGVAMHLIILLFKYAYPNMSDSVDENGVLTISFESDLYFPSAEKISDQTILFQELYKSQVIKLDFTKVERIDSAASQSVKKTIESLIKKDLAVSVEGNMDDKVMEKLKAAGIFELLAEAPNQDREDSLPIEDCPELEDEESDDKEVRKSDQAETDFENNNENMPI
ncbi:Oidioi.mRNA.OKI2018_I69.chr1.g2919.t1.cds [Oikopleura dioica]|uniref:Oidioi.mRNA.OKI2018_I69.chr1.g2919.t1.cds n=1 Tax=Oikopleura dioica TaxID=34765 RepID=A0ABN7SZ02_OIKDI|nr:Oidioi.mRNA.OKI2018_I69.chr1.g2919.t1.cds [Oikopleura dioica]